MRTALRLLLAGVGVVGFTSLVHASDLEMSETDVLGKDTFLVPIQQGAWVIETFDGALSYARWRSGPGDALVPEGGHADGFLHTGRIASEAPSIGTIDSAINFVGLFRVMGVADLGIDVKILEVSSPSGDRPVSLELIRAQGAPGDPTDDCVAVQVGKRLSHAERGWQAYTFRVPAYMTRLPSGWTVRGMCGQPSEDEAWNRLMELTSQARFVLGDPDALYPSQDWQIGFDNPRIRIGGRGGEGKPVVTDPVFSAE